MNKHYKATYAALVCHLPLRARVSEITFVFRYNKRKGFVPDYQVLSHRVAVRRDANTTASLRYPVISRLITRFVGQELLC